MKKLFALLLAFVNLVCFSCGQDNPADDVAVSESEETAEPETEIEEVTSEPETAQNEVSDFVGKWQGVKIIEDGEESDIYEDIPVYAYYQIEFFEDGSVKFGETTAKIAGHENSWRWNRMENSTEIEFFDSEDDENKSILTFDGDYLVYEDRYEDHYDILYLERVDKFTPYSPEEVITTENVTHEYIDADPTAFLGKWETRELTVDSDKQYLMGMSLIEVCQLEIYDDNTAVISGKEITGAKSFVDCEWGMVSENELELVDVNGKNILFTLDGNYLVCNVESIVVALGRVDEFTPEQSEEKTETSTSYELTNEKVIGKWQGFYMIDENNEKVTDDAVSMIYQFEFNEDGTVSFGELLTEYHNDDDVYKWEISGNNINVFNSDDEINVFNYRGIEYHKEDLNCCDYKYCLIYNYDGKEICLEKVDEFIPVHQ